MENMNGIQAGLDEPTAEANQDVASPPSACMSIDTFSTQTIDRSSSLESQEDHPVRLEFVREPSSSLGCRTPDAHPIQSTSSGSPMHPGQQQYGSAESLKSQDLHQYMLRAFEESLITRIEAVVRRTMLEVLNKAEGREVSAEDEMCDVMATTRKRKMSEIRQCTSNDENDSSSTSSEGSVYKKQKVGATEHDRLTVVDVNHE